ncbi:MAG: tetratricopeptide repeat protein [Owenweeksia sp.]|nr:tetratricopeptide repeat protein [Owenweeksia sp.]
MKNPKAYAIYGDYLSRDGRNQEALKAYKKAVQLEGGNRFKIWEQILLIEAQSERYDSLAVDASAAVELYPNQPLPYLFAGMAYSMLGDAFEAVGYLEDGLNYVLGNARLKEQFYTQLASAYHELGEHEKSDANFEKALALNDQNPTVLNNYAYYLSVRGQKLDRALEMTKKSNRLEESNPVFMDTWAWVLYKKGNYAEALAKMEQLLKLGVGNNGEVLEHYGDILYKNGRVAEAIVQWKKARSTGMASGNIDQKINREKLVE